MAPKKKVEEYSVELRFGRTKANLHMGIVGLPNVGKSSFFNVLTKQTIAASNFPFCTIDPNKGQAVIPDARYDTLCEMYKPRSKVPAVLNVLDIAGLVKGAHSGAGLGNAFLSHVMAVDGIYHMVRIFDDADITHVDDTVDPVRDMETIIEELCLKDLAYFDAAEDEVVKKAKRANAKIPDIFLNTCAKIRACLEDRRLLSKETWSGAEVENINLNFKTFLTTKPMIYLMNMSPKQYLTRKSKWLPKVLEWVNGKGGGTIIPFSVAFEEQYIEAAQAKEAGDGGAALDALKAEWALKLGCDLSKTFASQMEKIIKTGFADLNLLNFFTCGEDEVRSWTVYKGAMAPQAASSIHNDFEKHFIKAETVSYDDFIANTPAESHGGKVSMAGVVKAGKLRMEGKTYVVKDGDILNIKENSKKK